MFVTCSVWGRAGDGGGGDGMTPGGGGDNYSREEGSAGICTQQAQQACFQVASGKRAGQARGTTGQGA